MDRVGAFVSETVDRLRLKLRARTSLPICFAWMPRASRLALLRLRLAAESLHRAAREAIVGGRA